MYRHREEIGSGWTRVTLDLSDIAVIEFHSSWMGSGSHHFRLLWDHQPVSELHGVLRLRSVQRYGRSGDIETALEKVSDVVCFPESENNREYVTPYYDDVTYEYVTLPQGQRWLRDDASIDDMRPSDCAVWLGTFDLLLFSVYSRAMIEGKFDGTGIGFVLSYLDKMKFVLGPLGVLPDYTEDIPF